MDNFLGDMSRDLLGIIDNLRMKLEDNPTSLDTRKEYLDVMNYLLEHNLLYTLVLSIVEYENKVDTLMWKMSIELPH